jgi:hypothetical protein
LNDGGDSGEKGRRGEESNMKEEEKYLMLRGCDGTWFLGSFLIIDCRLLIVKEIRRRTDDRGRKTDDREQKTEDRRQKTDDREKNRGSSFKF